MTHIEQLTKLREDTIKKHHQMASDQLDSLVKENPLATSFTVYDGCNSEEMTKEICYRFNLGGVSAVVSKIGLFSTQWSIIVKFDIPDYLKHSAPVPEVPEQICEQLSTPPITTAADSDNKQENV